LIRVKETPKNLLITFPYNELWVKRIKTLPSHRYSPTTKEWIVPREHKVAFLQLFEGEGIELFRATDSPHIAQEKRVVTFSELKDTLRRLPLRSALFKHQEEALQFGLEHPCFLLADQQGLGKSLESLAIGLARRSEGMVLVVCCVAGSQFNWLEQVHQHTTAKGLILGTQINKKGEMRIGSTTDKINHVRALKPNLYDVLIVNIEALRNPNLINALSRSIERKQIATVIIDEFSRGVKSSSSQQGKAIHLLRAPYRIAVTGTPIVNAPLDAYNALKWLGYETNSYNWFRNQYTVYSPFLPNKIEAFKNLGELRERLSEIMIRREKNTTLSLPPKLFTTEFVEMNKAQREIYKQVQKEIQDNIDLIVLLPNPLAKLTRLRQAATHTGLISTIVEESAKFERAFELIEDILAAKEKVIVFTNWVEVLRKFLEDAKKRFPRVRSLGIHGETKNRQIIINEFQQDPTFAILGGTIGSMGTAYTLHAASNVIFLDKPWTYTEFEQACDRVHRIGQTSTVNVYSLVAKDTVDEKVERLIERKAEYSNFLVEGKAPTAAIRTMLLDILTPVLKGE